VHTSEPGCGRILNPLFAGILNSSAKSGLVLDPALFCEGKSWQDCLLEVASLCGHAYHQQLNHYGDISQ
jgi:hypothetical protein